MDLRTCRQVILFGGSFDPPHMAHVLLPMLARETIGADAVAYIPAGQAPHKLDRRQTPAQHRLAMLRLTLAETPWATVLTDEIDRTAALGRPSYTVETLQALRQRLGPRVRLRLLIGADQLRIFHLWREPERIVELAEPLVMLRPPDTRDSLLQSLPKEIDPEPWQSRLIDLPLLDISSTDIRRRAQAGLPLSGLVAPPVEDYIRRHRLYGEAF